MSDKKLTLDDIFNNDKYGILDIKTTTTNVKTDEDRLVDVFETINAFVDKNHRQPTSINMLEYELSTQLEKFRSDESIKKILKPFDRHNLLDHVEMDSFTLDDILNDDSGILDISDDLSIFELRHIPKEGERAKPDYVGRRKKMGDKEFAPYEKMFHKVHQEIKYGIRRIVSFDVVSSELKVGGFYFIDGIMLYLEKAEFNRPDFRGVQDRDGRTKTFFENGTWSNMYYSSLLKAIYAGGSKRVTELDEHEQKELSENV